MSLAPVLRRRLDLQGLLSRLVDARAPGLAEAVDLARLAAAPDQDLDAHHLLAQLMLRWPFTLRRSLEDGAAGTLTAAEVDATWRLLHHVASIYRPLASYEPVEVPVPAGDTGGITVADPVAAVLADQDLAIAQLVAATQPMATLVVADARLHVALGRYERFGDHGLVLIDLDVHRELRADPARTLGHELGHAVDPSFGSVDIEEAERFADAMRDRLLERRPGDLSCLYALVAEALEERPVAAVGADAMLADVEALAWYVGVELSPVPIPLSLEG